MGHGENPPELSERRTGATVRQKAIVRTGLCFLASKPATSSRGKEFPSYETRPGTKGRTEPGLLPHSFLRLCFPEILCASLAIATEPTFPKRPASRPCRQCFLPAQTRPRGASVTLGCVMRFRTRLRAASPDPRGAHKEALPIPPVPSTKPAGSSTEPAPSALQAATRPRLEPGELSIQGTDYFKCSSM